MERQLLHLHEAIHAGRFFWQVIPLFLSKFYDLFLNGSGGV